METQEPPREEQHQNQNGSNSGQTTDHMVDESPRDVTKNVYIYKNGDPFYRPHRFTVNSKQFRNYEAFLTQVTTTIRPRFGCVRKLHTPDHGRRVKDLDNLEPGKRYVAAGIESFAKLPYNEIPEKDVPKHLPPKPMQQITPVYHSRIQVSARARKIRQEPITIFVFENGNELKAASRVLITPREVESWEQILSAVSDRVTLSAKGAVRMLYTLAGQRVSDMSGLKNGESYVAVAGDGRFMNVIYGHVRKPLNTSPKLDRKRYERLELDGLKSKQTSNTRKGGRPAPRGQKKSTGGSTSSRTTEEDVFRNGSQGSRGSQRNGKAKQTNYDNKDDGPFKSRRESGERRGATEVEEGDETKVDLPIDQVEAEEVQDDEDDDYYYPPPNDVDEETDKQNDTLEQDKAPTDQQSDTRTDDPVVEDELKLTKQPSNVNKNVNNIDEQKVDEKIEADAGIRSASRASKAERSASRASNAEGRASRASNAERNASRVSNVERRASKSPNASRNASRASNADERSASKSPNAEQRASRASNADERGASKSPNAERNDSRVSSNTGRSASKSPNAEQRASRASNADVIGASKSLNAIRNASRASKASRASSTGQDAQQPDEKAAGEAAETTQTDEESKATSDVDQAPTEEAQNQENPENAEEEERQRQQRARAAVKIQAQYRGHRVRKTKPTN